MNQFIEKAMCIVFLCCFITGCNNVRSDDAFVDLGSDTQEQEEITYYLDVIDMPDADDSLQEYLAEDISERKLDYGLLGKSVYRIVNLHATGQAAHYDCLQILQPPYSIWENVLIDCSQWEEGELWYIYSVCNDITDRLLVILYDGSAFALGSFSREEGGKLIHKLPGEIGNHDFILNSRWYSDEENNVYIHSAGLPKKVICHDGNMENKKEISIDGMANRLIWDDINRRMLYLGNKDGNYGIYTLVQEDMVLELKGLQSSCFGYCAASDTECYLADGKAVWRADFRGELSKQAEFLAVDYMPQKICGMTLNDNGLPLVLIQDEEGVYLMAQREGMTESPKQELVLTVDYLSPFWKKEVAAYNKQSKSYRVVVIELDNPEDRDLLRMQVTAGKGPDLIQSFLLDIDLSAYADKGYLLDLTKPLEEAVSYLPEGAINTGKRNGRVYAVPYQLRVDTMIVNRSAVNEKTGWTLDELLDIVENSGATVFSTESGPAAMVDNLVFRDVKSTRFIDHENGVAYLDGEDFQRVLDFVKNYLNTNEGDKDGQRVSAGEIFAYNTALYGTRDINFITSMFQGQERYIGYPCEEGGGHYIYEEALVVNQSTRCPEGAVDFLQYLLSQPVQDKYALSIAQGRETDFPVRKDSLEKVFTLALEKELHTAVSQRYMGISFKDEAMTKEQAEALVQVFETAEAVDYRNDFVYKILSEELPLFMAGERSTERTAEVIQNRVQLYLDENS